MCHFLVILGRMNSPKSALWLKAAMRVNTGIPENVGMLENLGIHAKLESQEPTKARDLAVQQETPSAMIDVQRIASPGKSHVLTETGPRHELRVHLAGNHRLPMTEKRVHPGNVQLLRLPHAPQSRPVAQGMCNQIRNRCPLLPKAKSLVQQSTLKERVLSGPIHRIR